ncbi:MAG: hypothetical protein Q3971_06710 [Moraxella sp.]|nr:hypothetical protein [Moraxella sp.]
MSIPTHMDGKTADIAKDGFSVMYEFYPKCPKDYPIYHDFDGGMVSLQHLPILPAIAVKPPTLGGGYKATP